MTAPPALAVVTVNWNGGREVVQNARTLVDLARRRGDVEIVLVDNASSDGSAQELAQLATPPLVQLVVNDRNAGFGPACNQGAQMTRAGLILFLNPDASPLAGDDPFGPLIEAADRDRAHAAFAPILEDPAGTTSHADPRRFTQFRRHATIAAVARELLLMNRLMPNSAARRREYYADHDRARPFEVEQPAAAAWALRRDAFLAVGGFDPRFVPAWWEDVDLARQLERQGCRTMTAPASRFVHRGRSVLTPIGDRPAGLAKPEFHRVFWRNLLRFADKWWGASGVITVRLLLVAGAMVRLAAVLAPAVDSRADQARAALAIFGVAFARR